PGIGDAWNGVSHGACGIAGAVGHDAVGEVLRLGMNASAERLERIERARDFIRRQRAHVADLAEDLPRAVDRAAILRLLVRRQAIECAWHGSTPTASTTWSHRLRRVLFCNKKC